MTDSKQLRQVIEDSGYKYSFIASKMGISSYSLQRKIENDNEFKASEIKVLSELLKISDCQRNQIFFA